MKKADENRQYNNIKRLIDKLTRTEQSLNNESLINKYQDNHLLICERKNLKEISTVTYLAIK